MKRFKAFFSESANKEVELEEAEGSIKKNRELLATGRIGKDEFDRRMGYGKYKSKGPAGVGPLGKSLYKNLVKTNEEVELSEAETNYVIKHKKTKQVLNTHSDYATAKDEHEGLGADKHEYGIYKQTKKDAALRNRNTYREEVEQIDEIEEGIIDKMRTRIRMGQKIKDLESDREDNEKAGLRIPTADRAERRLRKKLGQKIPERLSVNRTKNEEVEQIDEISTELKKRYIEKGGQDVVDRFTGRGKYERPRDPSKYTKTGRPKKSALNSPEAVKYREKLDNRREIVSKVSQEVHGKKRFGEEVELEENFKEGDKVSFTTDYGTKQKGVITNPHTRTVKGKRHAEVRVGISPNTWSRVHVPHHRLEKVSEEVELDEGYNDPEYIRRAIPVLRNAVDFHKELSHEHDKKSTSGSPEYVRAHSAAAKAHREAAERHEIAHAQLSHGSKDVEYYVKPARELGAYAEKLSAKANALKEEFEINEASDLRITKIYNKWPKKATYAVHTPDRKYFKEFDSEDAAKKHLESKKS